VSVTLSVSNILMTGIIQNRLLQRNEAVIVRGIPFTPFMQQGDANDPHDADRLRRSQYCPGVLRSVAFADATLTPSRPGGY
jgi:hypothetical protein